jgi:hypothetical protein
MTYSDVASMAESYTLSRRITAGAAKESISSPEQWTQMNRWEVAAQPGWDAAWASAVAGGVTDPGSDEGVITDGMILSGIQAVVAANTPAPPAP